MFHFETDSVRFAAAKFQALGIKRGFGEEEASFSPAKSFRPDDKDIPLRDRFREDRGGRESRWGKQEENSGGRKPSSGSNPPAGIPDEGGKNANLKPLGTRKPRGGRGGANTGETMQEKLARMAGMTAPLPDTPSRKAKTWEQVEFDAHGQVKLVKDDEEEEPPGGFSGDDFDRQGGPPGGRGGFERGRGGRGGFERG